MGKACLPVVKYIITIKMSRVFVSTCMWKYLHECENIKNIIVLFYSGSVFSQLIPLS